MKSIRELAREYKGQGLHVKEDLYKCEVIGWTEESVLVLTSRGFTQYLPRVCPSYTKDPLA